MSIRKINDMSEECGSNFQVSQDMEMNVYVSVCADICVEWTRWKVEQVLEQNGLADTKCERTQSSDYRTQSDDRPLP